MEQRIASVKTGGEGGGGGERVEGKALHLFTLFSCVFPVQER